jgi:hypothetical protein
MLPHLSTHSDMCVLGLHAGGHISLRDRCGFPVLVNGGAIDSADRDARYPVRMDAALRQWSNRRDGREEQRFSKVCINAVAPSVRQASIRKAWSRCRGSARR